MKRKYQTCDLMHGNICVSEPCICKGMHMSEMRKKKKHVLVNKKRKPKGIVNLPIMIREIIKL